MANIGILTFDGVDDLDFVGVACVLGKASELSGSGLTTTIISCLGRDHVISAGGLRIGCESNHGKLVDYDALVFPGGRAAQLVQPSVTFQTSLRDAIRRGTAIYSVCSGAFILAKCGVLPGRKVAIHADKGEALALAGNCTPMIGIVQDEKIWSIGGPEETGCPKSISMGFLILEHFHPAIVSYVRKRLEIFPIAPAKAGLDCIEVQ